MVVTHIFYEFYDKPLFLNVECYHESWDYNPIRDQKTCEDLCGFALETLGPKCCYNSETKECIKPVTGKSSLSWISAILLKRVAL